MGTTNPNKATGSAIFNFLPGTISAPGIGFMNVGGVSGAFFEISHDLSTRFITKRSPEGYVDGHIVGNLQIGEFIVEGISYIDRSDDGRYQNNPLEIAEFDDSLVEMHWWAGPRYKGCKTTGKAVNKYTPAEIGQGIGFFQVSDSNGNIPQQFSNNGPAWEIGNYQNFETYEGDQTFGLNPVISNQSTAIYIANTIIGGEEDKDFATIQKHSYIGIQKILAVDINADTVDVMTKTTEDFADFNRFITNDLPTGGAFSMKVLDESVSTNLKQSYFCKMNKGWLLKTFDFVHAGEFSGSRQDDGKGCVATYDGASLGLTNHENGNELTHCEDHLTTQNAMYLYRDGGEQEGTHVDGLFVSPAPPINHNAPSGSLRFRYGTINMYAGDTATGKGDIFDIRHMGPNYVSSSILSNKYTRQFYSGAFGTIENFFSVGTTNAERMANSDLGKASRFIGVNCLDFLRQHNADPNVPQEEKTELHITFLQGVKDFSNSISGSGKEGAYQLGPSANDERSIGTFEVDSNPTALDIGDHCNAFLPQTHELIFKGANDGRFTPSLDTFQDIFQTAYLQYTGSGGISVEDSKALFAAGKPFEGCVAVGEVDTDSHLQRGININKIFNGEVFLQGGALGPVGHVGAFTASVASDIGGTNYRNSISGAMTVDNYYGGYLNSKGSASLDWQLSFLDKDHVIIANVDKDIELFDGIGTKGVAIVPEHAHPRIKQNLEIYLKKAGIITDAPSGLTNTIIE